MFFLFLIRLWLSQQRVSVHLQKVDAAGAGGWGDPYEAESGGGLVADVRGHHAANELGSSKLPLGHHTWTGPRGDIQCHCFHHKAVFLMLQLVCI